MKLLELKPGINDIEFSVTTAIQGTSSVKAKIFLFESETKFIISDIDGTITASTLGGLIFPVLGIPWYRKGVAQLFETLESKGYQIIYLSSRPIGLSQLTRNLLNGIKQDGHTLPNGPLLISSDGVLSAINREFIAKNPDVFKTECLQNILSLYPLNVKPFISGFGNQESDQKAYEKVETKKIFIIGADDKITQPVANSYTDFHNKLANKSSFIDHDDTHDF